MALASTTSVARPLRHRARAPSAPTESAPRLTRLLRERLRKCSSLLPKVLTENDPDAVHDLRVWTRRLQQVLVTMFPAPAPPEARAMVRALRRMRGSLGAWRDCDVLIVLLGRKLRGVRNPEEKRGWEMIRDWALEKRERRMRRARRRLAGRRLLSFGQRAGSLMELASRQSQERNPDPAALLAPSVRKGYEQWREALARACETFEPADIHAFRIRSKRLRYRIELARDLGDGGAERALSSLRALQDELGRWHDHGELARLAAQALADPTFLLEQPRVAGAILRKLDRDRAARMERIRRFLTTERDAADDSALHAWVTGYCGAPPAAEAPDSSTEPDSSAEPD